MKKAVVSAAVAWLAVGLSVGLFLPSAPATPGDDATAQPVATEWPAVAAKPADPAVGAPVAVPVMPPPEGTLLIGTGQADITPVVGLGAPTVWLAGYKPGRKAVSVGSPLSVRVITISDGRRRVALAVADSIGLFLDETRKVRQAAAEARPPLPVDWFVLCSTHTHAAPDTIGMWGPLPRTGVDPAYLAMVRERTLAALRDALAAEKPCRLRIARTQAPDYIGDSRLPKVIDQSLWVITADDTGGKPVATVTNWGIHPEVLDSRNTAVSADFPHVLREELEALRGCRALHFSGSVGGLTAPAFPARDDRGEAFADDRNDRVTQYGKAVARIVAAALPKSEPLSPVLDFRSAELHVPVTNGWYRLGRMLGVLRRETFAWVEETAALSPAPAPKADEKPSPPRDAKPAAPRSDAKSDPAPVPGTPAAKAAPGKVMMLVTEVGLLRIGEAGLALIPGEIYPELVVGGVAEPADAGADHPDAPVEPLIFDQMQGARHRLVLGLAGDEIGYLIPKRQWDSVAPWCYGRKSSQYGEENSCGAESGPRVCEAFRKLAAGMQWGGGK